MITLREDAWNDRDNAFRTDEINHDKYSTTTNIIDPDDDEDLDEDDDLDYDEDLDDPAVAPDVDEDYDDDLDDEDEEEDDDITAEDQSIDEEPDEIPTDPGTSGNEIPEQGDADNEDLEYPHEAEVDNQREQENDAPSYSEQNDVTPPEPHTFPGVGPDKADFESRSFGRSTGRMIEHEPGTEGI